MHSQLLHHIAVVLVVCTLLLILAGLFIATTHASPTLVLGHPGIAAIWANALDQTAHAGMGTLTFGAGVLLSIQVSRNILPRSLVQLTSQNMSAAS